MRVANFKKSTSVTYLSQLGQIPRLWEVSVKNSKNLNQTRKQVRPRISERALLTYYWRVPRSSKDPVAACLPSTKIAIAGVVSS